MRCNCSSVRRLVATTACVLACGLAPAMAAELTVTQSAEGYSLALPGGDAFHTTQNLVLNERLIEVPDSSVLVALWEEELADGGLVSHYSISLDGQSFARVRQTSYSIQLVYAEFDPQLDTLIVPAELQALPTNTAYIVQFVTPALEVFQDRLNELGATIHTFASHHAAFVTMPPEAVAAVDQLPYVRWVGPLHPAYKLDQTILAAIESGADDNSVQFYSVMTLGRGMDWQEPIVERIVAMGGDVINTNPLGHRMTVMLTLEQVLEVARMDVTHFIDPWGPGELDVDKARKLSGADPTIYSAGYYGEGVRGEIFDTGISGSHPDFQNPPPIWHNGVGGGGHGTNVCGIPFGNGTGMAQATGFCPNREQIISSIYSYSSQFGGPIPRHQHTAELVDPLGQYRAVLQTSSVGSPRTCDYTTISAETDDYLFISQLLSTQSQSNAGLNCWSRPQAWAKNNIGVGGIRHHDTLTRDDDYSAGSTGPASDNRIKPDFAHFYDYILTTSGTSGYTYTFGGTSGATPCTVGNAGLFFNLWHEEVWKGHGGGATVFDSRAKLVTCKAMLVNTAHRYDWVGGPPANSNMWRDRQGWGMANIGNAYDLRDKTLIIDEEDLIKPLETNTYTVEVEAGEPELKVTLCYIDPKGNPANQSQHRINDLSLRVTSPSSVVYWGNNGLRDGNYSTPGGSSNIKDTVENVFIKDPEAGKWKVEVIGDEIVADSHVETPALDADYALVVTGIKPGCAGDVDGDGDTDPQDLTLLLAAWMSKPGDPNWDPRADLNGDNIVSAQDLTILLADWMCGT